MAIFSLFSQGILTYMKRFDEVGKKRISNQTNKPPSNSYQSSLIESVLRYGLPPRFCCAFLQVCLLIRFFWKMSSPTCTNLDLPLQILLSLSGCHFSDEITNLQNSRSFLFETILDHCIRAMNVIFYSQRNLKWNISLLSQTRARRKSWRPVWRISLLSYFSLSDSHTVLFLDTILAEALEFLRFWQCQERENHVWMLEIQISNLEIPNHHPKIPNRGPGHYKDEATSGMNFVSKLLDIGNLGTEDAGLQNTTVRDALTNFGHTEFRQVHWFAWNSGLGMGWKLLSLCSFCII